MEVLVTLIVVLIVPGSCFSCTGRSDSNSSIDLIVVGPKYLVTKYLQVRATMPFLGTSEENLDDKRATIITATATAWSGGSWNIDRCPSESCRTGARNMILPTRAVLGVYAAPARGYEVIQMFPKYRHTHSLNSAASDFVFLIYGMYFLREVMSSYTSRSTRDRSITHSSQICQLGRNPRSHISSFYK